MGKLGKCGETVNTVDCIKRAALDGNNVFVYSVANVTDLPAKKEKARKNPWISSPKRFKNRKSSP